MPGVDLGLVDEAERQPHVAAAAPVRIEERAGHDPDPRGGRFGGERGGVTAFGKRQPREEAAVRGRPADVRGHRLLERGQHSLALAPIQRP